MKKSIIVFLVLASRMLGAQDFHFTTSSDDFIFFRAKDRTTLLCSAITINSHQNICIAGTSQADGSQQKNAYWFVTDTAGFVSLAKEYHFIGNGTIEGSYQVESGNRLLYGTNNNKILIIKINEIGDTLWTRNLDTYNLLVANTNNHSDTTYLLPINSRKQSVGLLKLSKNGKLIAHQQYPQKYETEIVKVLQSIDGTTYMAVNHSLLWGNAKVGSVLLLDEYGSIIAQKELNSDTGSEIKDIAITNNELYVLCESINITKKETDILVQKRDKNANLIWTKNIDVSLNDKPKCIIAEGNYLHIAGDCGIITKERNQSMGFLLSLTKDSILVKLGVYGEAEEKIHITGMDIQGDEIVLCGTGPFNNFVRSPFIIKTKMELPQETLLSQHKAMSNDILSTTHDNLIDSITDETPENGLITVKIYPNPSSDIVKVNYTLAECNTGTMELFSQEGPKIASYPLYSQKGSQTIDTSKLKTGVYYVKIRTKKNASTGYKMLFVK